MAADAGQATPRDSAESRIQHPFGVLNPGCSTVNNFRVLIANWGLTSASCEFKGKNAIAGLEPWSKGREACYLTNVPLTLTVSLFVGYIQRFHISEI